jgi:H+/Cl- antiporter ClcA
VGIIEFNYGFKSTPPAISNLYLTYIIDYHMESTTALMFVVLGASMGLFGMVLLVMIKTFQEVKSKMA